ncbi:MAG: sensor histidine kinase [Clostridia bacterium]|nr:sensor histidine kinase [Clostridia bacterium]
MISFDVLLEILDGTFNFFASSFLFASFAKRMYSRALYLLIALGSIIAFILVGLFVPVTNTYVTILLSLIICFCITFIYEMKWYNRILFSFLSYALIEMANMCATIAVINIWNVYPPFSELKSVILMTLAWSKAILFLTVIFLKLLKSLLFKSPSNIDAYIILIFPVSILMVVSLKESLAIYKVVFLTKMINIVMVLGIVLVFSVVIIFNMTSELRGKAEEQAKLALIEKLLKGQEAQYRDMEKHGMDLLKIKHDQKHFLYGVLSALDRGDIRDIRTSVVRELNTVEKVEVPADPGSNLVYHLVSGKMADAEKRGIRVECEYHDIKEIRVSPIDFAIVLGNALDNAIEAAEKHTEEEKRRVTLIIKVLLGQIVVILKNYAPSDTDITDLRSDKSIPGHGFGLLSMKNIVEHYEGELNFELEQDIFTTYITLNNAPAGEI